MRTWTQAWKERARSAVNVEVRFGRMPRPNDCPCVDCDHRWRPGERRHEYDHHLGYARRFWLVVQSVCSRCHAKRDSAKLRQRACIRGHAFTVANTKRRANGTRECRACRRARETRRRTAAWWRARKARKAAANG